MEKRREVAIPARILPTNRTQKLGDSFVKQEAV